MPSSQSDNDKALEVSHTDAHVPEAPAAGMHTLYQTITDSGTILFDNSAAAQQTMDALTQAAANQGVMQIYGSVVRAVARATYGSAVQAAARATSSFYLVSLNTRQAVELVYSSESGLCPSREPKALSLFCHAHAQEMLARMNEKEVGALGFAPGEFAKWTDEDADERYKALTGKEPPGYAG